MKKIFAGIILFVSFGVICAQSSYSKINYSLDSLFNDEIFKTCIVSVDAYNLTSEKPIYAKNEKLLLRPASNQKVLTSAAALWFLGSDYTFKTKLYYTGSINKNTLNGDIYFVGGFDPDFTLSDLTTMVSKIKELGITKINGNIYADVSAGDSLFWGAGWMWDDDPGSDFPALTPLVINDNCVNVLYKPNNLGEKPIVEIIPNTKYVTLTNNAVTDIVDEKFDVTRNWIFRTNEIIVKGKLSINQKPDSIMVNVFDGNAYFMTLVLEEMAKQGININNKFSYKTLPDDAITIYVLERRFGDVINNLNKNSDNLSAEMTLRALALEFFGKPATAQNGTKMIDSLVTLAGFNSNNYRFADASGVSYYNLVSAEVLNGVVKFIYQNNATAFRTLYNSLPIGGVDGTLKNRMKTGICFNNVHAKTGTLSGISTLTGYLTAKNGALISFSIMTQNFVGSSRALRQYQDKICEILSNLE